MATTTSRLGLRKPNNTTDVVNVTTDISNNMDLVDAAVGYVVCTSSTRPGSPYTGQPIYETDTKLCYVWNGSAWAIANVPGFAAVTNVQTPAQNATTTLTDVTSSSQAITTVRANEKVRCDYTAYIYCNTATANSSVQIQCWLDSAVMADDSGIVWLVNANLNGTRQMFSGHAIGNAAAAGAHTVKLRCLGGVTNNLFVVNGIDMLISSEY